MSGGENASLCRVYCGRTVGQNHWPPEGKVATSGSMRLFGFVSSSLLYCLSSFSILSSRHRMGYQSPPEALCRRP
ncbi:hypothetical protein BDW75DRAFT_225972 [Aspergillus navahoensis]